MTVGKGADEHPGETELVVDGDVHREVRGTQVRGGADEVVDRVARGGQPGRAGVGDARRAVGLHDGGGGGQAGAGSLGSAAPSGEEVGLDKAGQDAAVGRHVAAIEQDGDAVHLAHRHVLVVVGPVLVDPVPVDDVPPHQVGQLPLGGRAMGAGGAQQLDPLRAGTGPVQLVQERGKHRGVGHGPGDVGKDHHHLVGGTHQVPEWPTRRGRPQGPTDRLLLIADRSGSGRPHHQGVVGHRDVQAVTAVGQGHPHGQASVPVPPSVPLDRCRPSTVVANRSEPARRIR